MPEFIADQKQREQALDPNQSFIVQAPAGSGKTSLLIKRFLVLLARVNKAPEEILAITFTRKAASEMHMRICNALFNAANHSAPRDPYKLKIWQLAKEVLQRDQKSNWNLLDNPNRLRISTIDGLCNSLTKQMPILSGFGAQPNIVQDQDAIECYRKAVRALLNSLEDEPPYAIALENLLLHLDNDYQKVEHLLINMLARRDQWLPHMMAQHDIEQSLANIINDNLENCKKTIPRKFHNELFDLTKFAVPESKNTDELTLWQQIANLLLTKNYQWRKTVDKRHGFPSTDKQMKQRMENLLKKLAQHEESRKSLEALLLSPTPKYSASQYSIIKSLTEILKILAAYYLKSVFQEQGVVDYIEVSLAALQTLGQEDNPTDLALKLDYKIQHILVDEFQDTSVTQYRLLEKLTAGWQPEDGRTLFLVGDPMQSIYKFREAKVGLFLRAKHYGINSIKLQLLTLSANFRSEKYLIDWVNSTFPQIFPHTENISSGAIPFISSTPIHNNENQPSVNIYHFSDKNYSAEAQQIIKIIQQNKKTNPQDTIAILIRNRAHLEHIIPALQAANLPYKAIELEPLKKSVVIQDLFALTKALLNPSDRIAWLSVLRAPWCGLTLVDLHTLANKNYDQPLWNTLNRYQELTNLSIDAKIRLQNLVNVLSYSLQNKDRKNLCQLVEETWLALDGPYCLRNKTELRNAQNYFKLLIESNTEDLALLEAKLETLYAEPDSQANDSFQIMTIHKAKGLEFDTVIIPGLNRKSRRKDDPLLLWAERPSTHSKFDSDLILAPIKASGEDHDLIYRYLQFEEQKKNYYETGRLLYVAVTRAKKALHLLACVDDKPNNETLLEQLWPCFTGKLIETKETIADQSQIKKIARLPSVIPAKAGIHKNYNTWMPDQVGHDEYYEKFLTCTDLPENTSKNIGIIIHNCLKQLSEIDLNNWLEKNLTLQRQIWRNNLIQLGTFDNLTQNINIIENAIKKTLQDPLGRWILDKNHQDAHSEYPLTLILNNKIQHIVIDRTFIDNDIRWIIDYKTGGSTDKQIYQEQLETYAEVMKYIDNRPIRLGLYFPLFAGWYVQ